jgi:hypothetical protein
MPKIYPSSTIKKHPDCRHLWFPEYSVVIVQVPKTGSSHLLHTVPTQNLNIYRHSSIETIFQTLKTKNLTSYAVVRNPYDRFISLYWHRLRHREFSGSFEEYVNQVVRKGWQENNHIEDFQWPYLCDNNGNLLVDHLYYFEEKGCSRIVEDLATKMPSVNINWRENKMIHNINPVKPDLPIDLTKDYLTPSVLRKLNNLLDWDFSILGYSKIY